jgi:hypothetical protein
MTGSIQFMIELVNNWINYVLQNEENYPKIELARYQLITVMILSDDFDLGGLEPVDAFHYVCENTKML